MRADFWPLGEHAEVHSGSQLSGRAGDAKYGREKMSWVIATKLGATTTVIIGVIDRFICCNDKIWYLYNNI